MRANGLAQVLNAFAHVKSLGHAGQGLDFAPFPRAHAVHHAFFNRAIKALGGKRWQMLHKLVYLIAGLGLLHFFWMRAGKNNFAEVAVYAAILGSLLGWRVLRALKGNQPATARRGGRT